MLMRFWYEISRMFLSTFLGVDYFKAKKYVFYYLRNKDIKNANMKYLLV